MAFATGGSLQRRPGDLVREQRPRRPAGAGGADDLQRVPSTVLWPAWFQVAPQRLPVELAKYILPPATNAPRTLR